MSSRTWTPTGWYRSRQRSAPLATSHTTTSAKGAVAPAATAGAPPARAVPHSTSRAPKVQPGLIQGMM
jgi:hypothetical protein